MMFIVSISALTLSSLGPNKKDPDSSDSDFQESSSGSYSSLSESHSVSSREEDDGKTTDTSNVNTDTNPHPTTDTNSITNGDAQDEVNPDANPDSSTDAISVTNDNGQDVNPEANPDANPVLSTDAISVTNGNAQDEANPEANPDTNPDANPDANPEANPDANGTSPHDVNLDHNIVINDNAEDDVNPDATTDAKIVTNGESQDDDDPDTNIVINDNSQDDVKSDERTPSAGGEIPTKIDNTNNKGDIMILNPHPEGSTEEKKDITEQDPEPTPSAGGENTESTQPNSAEIISDMRKNIDALNIKSNTNVPVKNTDSVSLDPPIFDSVDTPTPIAAESFSIGTGPIAKILNHDSNTGSPSSNDSDDSVVIIENVTKRKSSTPITLSPVNFLKADLSILRDSVTPIKDVDETGNTTTETVHVMTTSNRQSLMINVGTDNVNQEPVEPTEARGDEQKEVVGINNQNEAVDNNTKKEAVDGKKKGVHVDNETVSDVDNHDEDREESPQSSTFQPPTGMFQSFPV